MSVQIFQFLLNGALCLAAAYFVYVFMGGEEGAEAKEEGYDAGFADAYLGLTPEKWRNIRAASVIIPFLLGYLAVNVAAGLLLAGIGYAVPLMIMRRLRIKRVRRIEQQLVEGLELLGNGLKSGLTMQQSMELLVREFPPPISQEFSRIIAETRLGVEFTEALERMAERLDSTVLYILATGVTIAKQCGGDMTQIFSTISSTIREQATIEGKLDSVTAQGRFQGLVLGLMPFALMIVLYFVDPTHIQTLFTYRLGLWAVCAVIAMVVMAQLWIRKLLAIDV